MKIPAEVLKVQQALALAAGEPQLKELMKRVGYGRTMQLAQEEWAKTLKAQGLSGGEFAYGPCVGLTVPCGCKGSCDWCCGSGWLTKHVKKLKDSSK